MRKSTFTEEQIAYALTRGRIRDAGARGVSQAGDQRADLLPLEAQVCGDGRSRAAPAAPARGRESPLEAAGGGPDLDRHMLQEVIRKKLLKPAQQKRSGGLRARRLCGRVSGEPADVIGCHRKTYRYRSRAKDQTALRMRLRELASVRVRYGYRRLHPLLRREGWRVNHKRVYRLYRLGGPLRALQGAQETRQRACDRPLLAAAQAPMSSGAWTS